MPAPTIPYSGKDTDRLARLGIALQALMQSAGFLENWPLTVANHEVFKQRIDNYQLTFVEAIHGDRRTIAKRQAACEEAGTTWQKIVNYACSTEKDNTELLEAMGVTNKSRRAGTSNITELQVPDLTVVNLDEKGSLKASCPYERRSYTYEIWMTEGDPRVEEGWFHKASFGDCTLMVLPGFQSGKEYSLRCRIIGRDNKVGPWSHTITIMVT
jgi:hypothetical protein